MNCKTFKQLVETISKARTRDTLLQAQGDIMASFQHDKITARDFEVLTVLVGTGLKAYVEEYRNR